MISDFGDIHENVGKWLNRLADYLNKPVVYDIGAHTGMFSIALARKGCSVVAFEPVPATLEGLRKNIHEAGLESDITVIPRGLANQDQHVLIHQFSDETFNSIFPRDPEQQKQYHLESYGHAEIHVQPLDDMQKELNLPLPALIKMDIEGAELFALQGASGLLRQAHPVILVEYSTENCMNAGYERREIVHELQLKGYIPYGLFRNKDEKLYGASRFSDKRIWNLIAVPESRHDAFSADFSDYIEIE
ncbi:FkbM family methyltransferase [Spirochaeta dissipatitropha]